MCSLCCGFNESQATTRPGERTGQSKIKNPELVNRCNRVLYSTGNGSVLVATEGDQERGGGG